MPGTGTFLMAPAGTGCADSPIRSGIPLLRGTSVTYGDVLKLFNVEETPCSGRLFTASRLEVAGIRLRLQGALKEEPRAKGTLW
jgi:hypothetical protein